MDYLLFASLVVALFAGSHLWLRTSRSAARPPWVTWTVIAAIVLAGWYVTDRAGQSERLRIQQMVEGFAPTYAQEVERLPVRHEQHALTLGHGSAPTAGHSGSRAAAVRNP